MIYLTQLIFVHAGKEELFHQFEDLAIPLMEKYKGRVIYRIRPDNKCAIAAEEELPYEIHFISFESEHDLNKFMQDDERMKFIHLKNESVKSTLLIKGQKL